MNPEDPLAQLKDIHLPETGGWWPPAPGWWVLAALCLIALIALVWAWQRHRARTAWKRQAKAELATLSQQMCNDPAWYGDLNRLLKRVARQTHQNRYPESMTGDEWAAFLLETLPKDRIASRPTAEALVAAAWQPKPAIAPRNALAFASLWLEAQL
ncbi:DUF4381 domain-containing protein [Marinobacter sp. S0848L]|uniref:DUF4381 domain-containing protein n=1 Tax=Marinobacter sp. S0848L TaxID=2926423 RepID=UPI001FF39CDA|nr:DUF4381 domain-containing protein [Marinobacter sp. S0848L]MCK0107176.1 DUF4381 domain-containing protein [Marinobacter sp. S0848L]